MCLNASPIKTVAHPLIFGLMTCIIIKDVLVILYRQNQRLTQCQKRLLTPSLTQTTPSDAHITASSIVFHENVIIVIISAVAVFCVTILIGGIMLRRRIQRTCRMCIKDTTNTSASEEYGQTQKSDHKRKDKEEEKLISISSLFLDFSSYRPLGQNVYTVKKCLFLKYLYKQKHFFIKMTWILN